MIVLSVLALAFYLLAIIASLHLLLSPGAQGHRQLFACAGLALLCHLFSLTQEVLTQSGQNLSLLNVASLVSFIISAFMTGVTKRFNGWLLLPVVYGFSALLIVADTLIPNHFITHLESHPQLLLHIGLALIAYSVLSIASLFALQLAYLDYRLKARKLTHLPAMPPLMTVEKRLFRLMTVGLFLLTLSIASGFFFLSDMFAQGKAHKAILSIIAWCVYVFLLWGHHVHGWRGRKVVWLSLLGSLILTLAYFGSRFVKEILLS
ncbi:inner membrane protein YpjD [Aeromonas schubertii]|uniref:ABC transporter permease n=1 Tax=Aeromonas schubertii TaxID=652 RepID=A0A0S2SGT4_9GAMM|nr:cytochrome c biogenesis protein CcsA [Aeromonas schubertii]ALP40929.1 ABC transporter permease [Aeromonas schubertii]KUE81022.1 chromosome partitioning protein ParB [Aeromonas schubertii]MBZ6064734.1 cytochrome c biogenesis protein CcsA [Aeromonas schubertii]